MKFKTDRKAIASLILISTLPAFYYFSRKTIYKWREDWAKQLPKQKNQNEN